MANQGTTGPSRALIVEDAVEIQDVVTALLREEGFDVRAASDGEQAIEVARAFEPDLIVLDLSLPGLDGIQVCQRIRTFSEAYILILTAKSDEVDKVVGLSVGADDYVTKPFSPRELVARVRVLFSSGDGRLTVRGLVDSEPLLDEQGAHEHPVLGCVVDDEGARCGNAGHGRPG